MQIRPERPDEDEMIARLVTEAFATAQFSGGNEAEIVARLRADHALAASLVAEHDGQIIGHVAFSSVSIGTTERAWFGLGPLAVAQGFRRRGIGGALVSAGLAQLRADDAAGCVVLGDPNYYGRFGFAHDPAVTFGNTGEHLQCLSLAGATAGGEVVYHRAFLEEG